MIGNDKELETLNAFIAKVADSTALLLLLSQNYIDSEWCGKELDHFTRAHGTDPGKPADVFVVALFPFEAFTGVPASIQNLRKRLIHAKFWHQPADAASPLLAGYPTAQESEPESGQRYWRALQQLRNAIDSRLRALGRDASSKAIPVLTSDTTSTPAPRTEKPRLGAILTSGRSLRPSRSGSVSQ